MAQIESSIAQVPSLRADESADGRSRGALAAGGILALLGSACCAGPLVLVSLGLGGAWLSNFALLEPYRLVFLGAALVALAIAARRIFRSQAACAPDEVCALPQTRRTYKALFWVVAALIVLAGSIPYAAPYLY